MAKHKKQIAISNCYNKAMARKSSKKSQQLNKKSKPCFIYKIPLNILFALVLFIAFTTLLHAENQKLNQKVLGRQVEIKEDQKTAYQWEKIVEEKPDCRDCWLQLSAAYLKLGEKIKARQALNSAKQIDPNNEHILSLEKLLEGSF